jgi:preprotein translocase subunit Sec61beta
MMTPLLIVWAGLTVALIILLIYRSTLSMHEDDQLFLDSAEAHMAKEQEELIGKMNRITPWLRVCGAGSVALLAIIAGMMLYERFQNMP